MFRCAADGDALLVKATAQDFSLRKHNLVQAILAVNDLFYFAIPVVARLFLEDVTAWLELHDIRFTPNVKFTGRSGYDHPFDFVVAASKRAPKGSFAQSTGPAAIWRRRRHFRGSIQRKCGRSPVLWSRRDEVRQELAA